MIKRKIKSIFLTALFVSLMFTVVGNVNCIAGEENPFGKTEQITGVELTGEIYFLDPDTSQLPDFSKLKPVGKLYANSVNIPPRSFDQGFPGISDRFEWFGVVYTGSFSVKTAGEYNFAVLSDDGSKLYIDGKLVINNDGVHAPSKKEGSVYLTAGTHSLRLEYFQGPRYEIALQLFVTAPGSTEKEFSIENYTPPAPVKETKTEVKTNTTVTTTTSVTSSLEETINDKGTIDWVGGIVRATGYGAVPANASKGQAKLMARRAAITDAQRNIAEVIFGVRVSSETYVKNFVTESDEIRTKVNGIIKNAQIVEGSEKFDGEIYQVDMIINLFGGNSSVSAVVIPDVVKKETNVTVTTNVTVNTAPATTAFTGIIIDARGLGLKPAMSPKVVDVNGDEVYGTMFVDTSYAIEIGIVGYAKDFAGAKLDRVGNDPLIVKAIDKNGAFKANAVVSLEDAQKIKAANEKSGLFKKCAVVFIVD